MAAQKIYAGTALKELRSKLSLTQREFSNQLDVSISYLNQMENNNRPIAAGVMLALARDFDFDVSELGGGDSARLIADLQEAFADPVFVNKPSHADMQLIASNAPVAARAILDLHRSYLGQQERLLSFDAAIGATANNPNPQPWEEVRDFFHYCDNYIDSIDHAAERLAGEIFPRDFAPMLALLDWFKANDIHVERVDHGMRHYDSENRILTLAQHMEPETQLFQMGFQIGLIKFSGLINATLDMAAFQSPQARDICRIGLANYFAGALMMPYTTFANAALNLRHDLEALALKFSCSIEQVAHRLSTLQRPSQKGVPFFFVRVDQAGTITKRHSATRLQFARFGGACPLWNVHRAFETPGDFLRQFAQTPDGVRYLCLAKDVSKKGGSYRAPVKRLAIGLGCEVEHAHHLIYADDLDAKNPASFEPIGISCRICPRTDCHQRAVPPHSGKLEIDPNTRNLLPYSLG